ncbi:MAG: (2Fe-2S) ferredoxin domain-containing protein [Clostridiales bacterium]|jgi:NADP-reducing hydrogenase subunit HndB|nr:(2Fe-2S) ferredoxin domain-containing protein [Clostridiales bacterium]
MEKLTSWDALKNYREKTCGQTSLLCVGEQDANRVVLAVGEATCGVAAGAKKIADTLQEEIDRLGLKNASIIATGCFGYCYAEPMVEVRMPGKPSVYYGYLTEEAARDIVVKHLVHGQLVENNVLPVEVNIP